jgi:hypothetical protein
VRVFSIDGTMTIYSDGRIPLKDEGRHESLNEKGAKILATGLYVARTVPDRSIREVPTLGVVVLLLPHPQWR